MRNETISSNMKLYSKFKQELNLPYRYRDVRDFTLEELDLTALEINWFLNQLEWEYGVVVQEKEITMNTSIEELFHQILNGFTTSMNPYMQSRYEEAV